MRDEESRWKEASRLFIAERAARVSGIPSIAELCYVSAKDPRTWRVWADEAAYQQIVNGFLKAAGATQGSEVLEIGCAAGLLARGVAQRVRRYAGVDIARNALAVARRQKLQNADFYYGDATRLPFVDATFDTVLCCDVFNNFPSFGDITPILDEMMRVLRAGGKALIGAVPDDARRADFEKALPEIIEGIESAYPTMATGPIALSRQLGWRERVLRWLRRIQPAVTSHYLRAEEFLLYARTQSLGANITELAPPHPFAGFRFNVCYEKPKP